MVTYVALLMLLQLRMAPAEATFLSALLFVPWVLKSFLRPWVRRVGRFGQMICLIEALLSAALFLLALAFPQGVAAVFPALLLVSLLCAWHELVARMYFESMLRPSFQRLLTVPKLVCSQAAVIFTYGALIFLVGTLQVYFRQMIRYSWSIGCYVAAGIFMLFAFYHLVSLSRSPQGGASHGASRQAERLSLREELRHRMGTRHTSAAMDGSWLGALFVLLFLLLPQGLMFHARVLYLYDTHARGGLQCTMQEIGFAQGTVGVIAFSLGIALGRLLINRYSFRRLFWPMAVSLVLSPFVYLGMTMSPPDSLWMLCLCTMSAQLLFGLGISICRYPISTISGNRYRNTINILQIPLVSAVLFVPMAVSGWLTERLGYDVYFQVNALSAPVCLLFVYLSRRLDAKPSAIQP